MAIGTRPFCRRPMLGLQGGLFWWILRAQLPTPTKLVLWAMALHCDDKFGSIYPSLNSIAAYLDRKHRIVTEHVTRLVTMGVLRPRTNRKGGHGHAVEYSIGIDALLALVDHTLPPPETMASPKLLKVILKSKLEPHRKLLLWAITMYGGQDVTKEQLARTMFRSTAPEALQQLRKDINQLVALGFLWVIDRRGGAGRGMTFQVELEALMKAALPPTKKDGYRPTEAAPLPFQQRAGTERTERAGTERTERAGTDCYPSYRSIGSGDLDRTGIDRKNLSEVAAGDHRPVHAVENRAPAPTAPLAAKRSRPTDWPNPQGMGFQLARATCSAALKKADDAGVPLSISELIDVARTFCESTGINRHGLVMRRSDSSPDLAVRAAEAAMHLHEQQADRRLEGTTGKAGGA